MKEMERKIKAAIAAATKKQVKALINSGCSLTVLMENTIFEGWELPQDYNPGNKPGEYLGDAVVGDSSEEGSVFYLYFRENGEMLVEEEWTSINTNGVCYYLVPAEEVRRWFNVRISCCA